MQEYGRNRFAQYQARRPKGIHAKYPRVIKKNTHQLSLMGIKFV